MPEDRLDHLKRFYSTLDRLAEKLGGPQLLENCNGRMDWPQRGVYFFLENNEIRKHSGTGLRIVRVGTHALKSGSRTTLWHRLSQHRGTMNNGAGNHRGSIFRLHVGGALLTRDSKIECTSWGVGHTAQPDTRPRETYLEKLVSQVIRQMPFVWVGIDDPAGPESKRGYLERNAIALLSNYRKPPLDLPSEQWLGRACPSERVRSSGLWNSNHVDEVYDPLFLDDFERAVAQGVR